jgi:hypothetical protein
MPAEDALLFIDANKYLDLYRTDNGKKLLAPLGEQIDHIFVTQQIVHEVLRNKISVAVDFIEAKFKELRLLAFNIPNQFSGSRPSRGDDIRKQMGDVSQIIEKANHEADELAHSILKQISCSKDEVSKALAPIFDKAVVHSPNELQRARDRRELGNPPGKSNNPIGDQLTWEQILTHFKGKKRLWIISNDGDYGTMHDGKGFLNRFLYEELCKVASDAEAFLFADMVEGIGHFVAKTGVTAEKRLTPEEIEEIKKEEKALSHSSQASEVLRRAMADLAGPKPPTMKDQGNERRLF